MAIKGAILGDIAGALYEFRKPYNWKQCNLFTNDSHYTDDTILTLAVKHSILNQICLKENIQEICLRYPYAGYGEWFQVWMRQKNPQPYNSFGNGAAMRVSFVGEYFDEISDVIKVAKETAEISHNHPEGIKGAIVTAVCIWLAKNKRSKEDIYNYVLEQYPPEKYEFSIDKDLRYLEKNYTWNGTCQGCIPVAMRCFYESNSFESFMRNLYRLNCDCDTLGAIGGGVCEEYYGLDELPVDEILNQYLDKTLLALIYE